MRPQVLYVTPMFGYPPVGGPRLRTYYTLRALSRHADVTLYVTQQPDTADRERTLEHMCTFCRDVIFPPPLPSPKQSLVRGVLHRTRVGALLRHARRVAQTRKPTQAQRGSTLDELRSWVALHQPDVIWLGFGGISYDLVPLKQLTDTPLVLETECVWSRFILRELPFVRDPREHERIVREGRAKEAEEREASDQVDVTTAVSSVDAEYFRSLTSHPERVMLLHNVVDVSAYQDAAVADLEQPALVFAGSLSRGTANVDAAVWLLDDIMPRIWRHRPDVHVYLVGRSPAPEIRRRQGRNVHVTGEVESIVPFLRAAVATLVPLRWESGTRFKILEAFAAHIPVVSTTLGAEGLAVEHGRHLLLADNAAAFASAVLSLIEDAGLRQALVGPAFDLVSSAYDVSSAERQIAEVLALLGWPAQTAVAPV
ncbi:MAG: glycosyltransferase [Chloroflexi bacterium]|nr:glycosyltransferase [Chloroflexota bacterium]